MIAQRPEGQRVWFVAGALTSTELGSLRAATVLRQGLAARTVSIMPDGGYRVSVPASCVFSTRREALEVMRKECRRLSATVTKRLQEIDEQIALEDAKSP